MNSSKGKELRKIDTYIIKKKDKGKKTMSPNLVSDGKQITSLALVKVRMDREHFGILEMQWW